MARAEFGLNHVIVTSDGLELHNSVGAQGMYTKKLLWLHWYVHVCMYIRVI